MKERESFEILQNSKGFCHKKNIVRNERSYSKPQDYSRNNKKQKKYSIKREFSQQTADSSRDLKETFILKKDQQRNFDKFKNLEKDIKYEIEKLREECKIFIKGNKMERKKTNTEKYEHNRQEQTWAEQLAQNHCREKSCGEPEIAKERYSLQHQCVCTSPRYAEDETLAPRPRMRSVAAQMTTREECFEQGAKGDHNSLVNLITPEKNNSKGANKISREYLPTTDAIVNCCYGQTVCDNTNMANSGICHHYNNQSAGIESQREYSYCRDEYYYNCAKCCNNSQNDRCSQAAPTNYYRRLNTDLDTKHFYCRSQARSCSPLISFQTKSKGIPNKTKESNEKYNAQKKKENEENMPKRTSKKSAEPNETRTTKSHKLSTLLSENDVLKMMKFLDRYVDDHGNDLRPNECTPTLNTKHSSISTSVTVRSETKVCQVTVRKKQEQSGSCNNNSLESQYSLETLSMLKKMIIREYKPIKPKEIKQELKKETTQNPDSLNKNKLQEKSKKYEQYLRKFKREQKIKNAVQVLKEPPTFFREQESVEMDIFKQQTNTNKETEDPSRTFSQQQAMFEELMQTYRVGEKTSLACDKESSTRTFQESASSQQQEMFEDLMQTFGDGEQTNTAYDVESSKTFQESNFSNKIDKSKSIEGSQNNEELIYEYGFAERAGEGWDGFNKYREHAKKEKSDSVYYPELGRDIKDNLARDPKNRNEFIRELENNDGKYKVRVSKNKEGCDKYDESYNGSFANYKRKAIVKNEDSKASREQRYRYSDIKQIQQPTEYQKDPRSYNDKSRDYDEHKEQLAKYLKKSRYLEKSRDSLKQRNQSTESLRDSRYPEKVKRRAELKPTTSQRDPRYNSDVAEHFLIQNKQPTESKTDSYYYPDKTKDYSHQIHGLPIETQRDSFSRDFTKNRKYVPEKQNDSVCNSFQYISPSLSKDDLENNKLYNNSVQLEENYNKPKSFDEETQEQSYEFKKPFSIKDEEYKYKLSRESEKEVVPFPEPRKLQKFSTTEPFLYEKHEKLTPRAALFLEESQDNLKTKTEGTTTLRFSENYNDNKDRLSVNFGHKELKEEPNSSFQDYKKDYPLKQDIKSLLKEESQTDFNEIDNKASASSYTDFKQAMDHNLGMYIHSSSQTDEYFKHEATEQYLKPNFTQEMLENPDQVPEIPTTTEDALTFLKCFLKTYKQSDFNEECSESVFIATNNLITKLSSCKSLQKNEDFLESKKTSQNKSTCTLEEKTTQDTQYEDPDSTPKTSFSQLNQQLGEKENFSLLKESIKNERLMKEQETYDLFSENNKSDQLIKDQSNDSLLAESLGQALETPVALKDLEGDDLSMELVTNQFFKEDLYKFQSRSDAQHWQLSESNQTYQECTKNMSSLTPPTGLGNELSSNCKSVYGNSNNSCDNGPSLAMDLNLALTCEPEYFVPVSSSSTQPIFDPLSRPLKGILKTCRIEENSQEFACDLESCRTTSTVSFGPKEYINIQQTSSKTYKLGEETISKF